MSTLKQVAELAGVSRRTVDRVLNNRGTVHPETEERVRRAIKELHYQPDETGQALAVKKKKLRFLFCSVKGKKSVIHEMIRLGAQKKAEEMKRLGVTVDFYTVDRDKGISEGELDFIQKDIRYDGLAIIPSEDEEIQKILCWAENKGIPMVFYNVDDKRFSRHCYVGCDYIQAGRLAAGLLQLREPYNTEIGIFTVGSDESLYGYPNYRERVKGFEEELTQCCPGARVVGHYLMGQDIFEYYDTARRAFEAHPLMNVVYLVNPGDYSPCQALKKAAVSEGRLQIITNDLTEESKEYLKNGYLAAVISQDPMRQGSLPLELLFEYLAFGRMPQETEYYTELSVYFPQHCR